MESIVMDDDQSAARARTGGFSGSSIDGGSRGVGYGGFSRARSSSAVFYSTSSLNGLNGNFGSFGPLPPPPALPIYSSLPPSFASSITYASPPSPQRPSFGLLPPPLLPLPPLSAAILPPGRKTANVSNRRSRDQRKKVMKATPGRRKEVPADQVKKLAAVETPRASPEEETAEYVYSLSPPPSSLPLPSFALILRARTAAAATAAAGVDGNDTVDGCGAGAGATPAANDLGRLLCL